MLLLRSDEITRYTITARFTTQRSTLRAYPRDRIVLLIVLHPMRNFCATWPCTWPDQIQGINASAILAGGWWRVYSVHKLYSEMSTGGTAF